jgi:hypothetical protein
MPKTPQNRLPHPEESARIRALFLFFIIVVTALGLIFIWKQLPIPSRSSSVLTSTSTEPGATTSTERDPPPALTKAFCESGGGHWNECGSACRGSDGPCIQVCVPYCECGGIAGWSCPKYFTCADYLPSKDTPDAMGICKSAIMDAQPMVIPEGMMCDPEGVICMSKSYASSTLANPFFVTGTVREPFNLTWLLINDTVAHPVYATGKVTIHPEPIGGRYAFETNGFLPGGLPDSALLIVEAPDTQEGIKVPKNVTMRVEIPQGESTVKYVIPENVQVYFSQSLEDFQNEAALAKQPMKTISEKAAATQTPIAASLAALVKWGRKEGILPETWPYYKVELKNGVACVHNDVATDAGMGKTLLIKETKLQFDPLVRATLKLFPSVKSIDCL